MKRTKEHTDMLTNLPAVSIKTEYYNKCTDECISIIDALMAVGEMDISLTHRTLLAVKNEVPTSNTTVMNKALLALLKEGKLKKV